MPSAITPSRVLAQKAEWLAHRILRPASARPTPLGLVSVRQKLWSGVRYHRNQLRTLTRQPVFAQEAFAVQQSIH